MKGLVKESEYFLAWLVFWLCSTIGGMVLGAVVGGILGGILGAAGADAKIIVIVGGVAGFCCGAVLSYAMFRLFVGMMIVKKIEERMDQPPAPEQPPLQARF